MTRNHVSIDEIKKAILNSVKSSNLTPSEILLKIESLFPSYSAYELKFVIKEMQKEKELVNDIIFGGLKAA